ncbi:MAG TPA: DNA topoisomerase IB [Burkholderiales bacterium]|jgi:DNA topoisomerase-1|nr:DNA topoisomerase IB [Burkholderiales bacterium]
MENSRAARAAGLRYVADSTPGVSRRRNAGGFRYFKPGGAPVRDAATLKRIRALAIPPAWTDVWICPREDGHIQATGRDARRRKQYRYHERWRDVRDAEKYGRLAAFARALPRIRRRVARDLALPGLPREKALATIVRLLETTFIRIGNEEYARANASFGLTTLRDRQVQVDGAKLRLRFRGKSGVPHEVALADRRLAHIVQRMQELPGEELFQYADEGGAPRAIESNDVNEYLRSIAGAEFTSKDFRTWAGTLLCLRALRRLPAPESPGAGRREVTRAVEAVARELRNTPAVCRKCYIHPAVVQGFLEGRLGQLAARSDQAALSALLAQKPRRAPSLAAALRQSLRRGRLGEKVRDAADRRRVHGERALGRKAQQVVGAAGLGARA